MAVAEGRSGVCLADLIAALSLGIDLGLGQPTEHVLRMCVLALGLSERFAFKEDDRSVVYYVALLAWVGCHADSCEQARWFGDDISARADVYTADLIGLGKARFAMRNVGAGDPPARRAGTVSRRTHARWAQPRCGTGLGTAPPYSATDPEGEV